MALRAVLAAGALLAVPGVYAGSAAQFQVSYAEYFSGIGSIYNQTTQQVRRALISMPARSQVGQS